MMMNQEIPEDLITDILWRLPIAGCIARFRCVSKSWRALLSDPSFILHQRDNKSVDDKSRRLHHQIIMINFVDNNNNSRRSVYSLHSASTLDPLFPSPAPLPINSENTLQRLTTVAGSCNALICVSDGDSDLILWNPATSETKLVLPSPFQPDWQVRAVGFGFDSETNDYKIVRKHAWRSWGRILKFAEVYSLRNDSWTKFSDFDVVKVGRWPVMTNYTPSQVCMRDYYMSGT